MSCMLVVCVCMIWQVVVSVYVGNCIQIQIYKECCVVWQCFISALVVHLTSCMAINSASWLVETNRHDDDAAGAQLLQISDRYASQISNSVKLGGVLAYFEILCASTGRTFPVIWRCRFTLRAGVLF